MKKIIVHHRSSHHAVNSGYGKLVEYLDGEVLPYSNSNFPYILAKFFSSLFKKGSGTYDSTSFIKDYELCKRILLKNDRGLVHYLNGERDIKLGIKLNQLQRKYKFVATFHKPPELFDTYFTNKSYFKKLDGAIAVGINQVDFLKERLNLAHVEYIPHGIDTTFFHPNYKIKKENMILFVGQHLRDFDMLNFVIPRLKDKISDIKVHIVLRQDFAINIISNSSVVIHSGIDDFRLRRLYQQAKLLFLPLKSSTACNSILEAMACGLPIVSTDVGGNSGYVNANSGVLLPSNDGYAMIETIVSLLSDSDKLIQMSDNCRMSAEKLNWNRVADEVEDFYQKVNN
jgi:glycosyltransferase involved in cell wall biosynthesis